MVNRSSTQRVPARRAVAGGLCCVLLLAAGCEMPPARDRNPREIDASTIETRDDITAIYRFYMDPPWLRDADGKVVGFKATVCFYSAETTKGAFVPGTIFVWIYEMEPQADGRREQKFVTGWEMDEKEAMGFRLRTPSTLGYRYGFMLAWPPNVDVVGKRIKAVFGYERGDGTIITEPGKQFFVPGWPESAPAAAEGLRPGRTPQQGVPGRDERLGELPEQMGEAGSER